MTFEQSLATLKAQLAELGVREDEIPRVEMQIVDWVPATAFNFVVYHEGTIESEVMLRSILDKCEKLGFHMDQEFGWSSWRDFTHGWVRTTYRMDFHELQ